MVDLNGNYGFMITRELWLKRIEDCWKRAPIVWLSGVRRVGKTTLVKCVEDARYINCDLPTSVRLLEDIEAFYSSVEQPVVIFDEVHRLPDPSLLLKIGADEFKHLKILATGSSTLAATNKFRDSLTGRKRNLTLLPVLAEELDSFGIKDMDRRLFNGGLPDALLSAEKDESFFSEWMDSYYARDVAELFNVGKRSGFLMLVEALLRQSGGICEVASLAKMSGLSRPTVMSYLDVLEITHLIHKLRPFHGGGKQELVRRAKVYSFDTGFVAHSRGWTQLRDDDRGLLWEHLVLDVLLTQCERVRYWRDKRDREVDFVLPVSDGRVDIVEAKWNAASFEPKNLRAFRALYPEGRNIVVSHQAQPAFTRDTGGLSVTYAGLSELRSLLTVG